MRRVQALTAQQLTDLTRPGAPVRLGKDPRLVLGGERSALGLLDQLRIADPLPGGAPASPKPQLAGSLGFVAGGNLTRSSIEVVRKFVEV